MEGGGIVAASGGGVVFASKIPCCWGVCVEVINRRVMAVSSGGVVVFASNIPCCWGVCVEVSSFLHRKFPAVGEFVWRW